MEIRESLSSSRLTIRSELPRAWLGRICAATSLFLWPGAEGWVCERMEYRGGYWRSPIPWHARGEVRHQEHLGKQVRCENSQGRGGGRSSDRAAGQRDRGSERPG